MGAPIRSSTEITQIVTRAQHALADIGLQLVQEEMRGINSIDTNHRDKMYRIILLRSYLHNILDDNANVRLYYTATANLAKFNNILTGLVQLSQSFDGPGINIIGVRRNLLFYTSTSGGGSSSGGGATPGGVTFQSLGVNSPGAVVDQITATDTDYAFYIIEIRGTNPGEGSRLDIIGFMWNGLATPVATEYRGADVGGSTAGVTITAALVAGQIQITANVPTNGWIIKGNRISFSNISFQNALAPMPIGGTTGQYIKKFSNTNYDFGWASIAISDITNLVATLTQYLLLTGGTMSGAIAMGGNKITGAGAATGAGDLTRYEQVLLLIGGIMSGNIQMGNNSVTGLRAATANGEALRYEQLPSSLPPNGAAGGDLSGNYPNPTIPNGSISYIKITPGAIELRLGYTPVQQGTGISQLGNTIKIGWTGARVRVTVDVSDQGNIVFDSNLLPGAWQGIPLINGWAAGARSPQYRIDNGGLVHLRGDLNGGSATNDIFTSAVPAAALQSYMYFKYRVSSATQYNFEASIATSGTSISLVDRTTIQAGNYTIKLDESNYWSV